MTLTQIRLSEQALDLSLTTAKIANLAVTTAKINDLAVTTAKINGGAVTVDKLSDFRVTAGTGLTVTIAAGSIRNDNVVSDYAGGTDVLAVADNTLNYIESSGAGVVTANTVGYTAGKYPLARVTTVSGVVTAVNDDRTIAEVNSTTADVDNFVTGTMVVRENASGDGLALDGMDTTFTLANTPIVGSEEVYLNGVLQQSGGADYTISGALITMTDAPVSTDRVLVTYRF